MSDYRDVMLVSEDYLKSNSIVDWNLAGKYIIAALKTAQEIDLREIIGDCLLDTIKQRVFDKDLDTDYEDLLDNYIQPYLAMQTLQEVIIPVSYKISNFGTLRSEDDKASNVNNAEVNLVREYYQNKANVYKRRLQEYLCKNKSKFPDVENCCSGNLYSAETSGLWLGGYRSKIVKKGCCGRD